MKPVAAHRAGGFTLVELLVAILILTLFMTASMGAVRIAGRSLTAGEARADAADEMRSVTDFMRRQFAQLTPLTLGEGNEKRFAFAGARDGVRFVAPAPQTSFGPGLMTVYLRGEPTADAGSRLSLRYGPFDPGSREFGAPQVAREVVLTEGLGAVQFRYYGAPMEDSVVEWRDAWPVDAERLPRAIHMRTREDQDAQGWPDVVFEIRPGGRS